MTINSKKVMYMMDDQSARNKLVDFLIQKQSFIVQDGKQENNEFDVSQRLWNEFLETQNHRSTKKKYSIVVVGLGYVGTSLAILLSQYHHVTVVDVDSDKIQKINHHKSHLMEQKVQDYLQYKLDLFGVTNGKSAYAQADYIFIATPTNYDEITKQFDTSSIENVIQDILGSIKQKQPTIIIKSTIPMGYTEELKNIVKYPYILFSPEFIRETMIIQDNENPSRIIVGTNLVNRSLVERALDVVLLLLEISKNHPPILIVNTHEAEAIKLFSNTYLAMRISFFNELDTYASMYHLDTKSLIYGVGLDSRIGLMYNNPSFGYGGYCLPKDTKQLEASYHDLPHDLIHATIQSNQSRIDYICKDLLKKYDGKVIGIYRLVMKQGSDNYRQSSVIDILSFLKSQNQKLLIYEPYLQQDTFFGIRIIRSLEEFKQLSNVIVANRYHRELRDVKDKVYTRDIYGRD